MNEDTNRYLSVSGKGEPLNRIVNKGLPCCGSTLVFDKGDNKWTCVCGVKYSNSYLDRFEYGDKLDSNKKKKNKVKNKLLINEFGEVL